MTFPFPYLRSKSQWQDKSTIATRKGHRWVTVACRTTIVTKETTINDTSKWQSQNVRQMNDNHKTQGKWPWQNEKQAYHHRETQYKWQSQSKGQVSYHRKTQDETLSQPKSKQITIAERKLNHNRKTYNKQISIAERKAKYNCKTNEVIIANWNKKGTRFSKRTLSPGAKISK